MYIRKLWPQYLADVANIKPDVYKFIKENAHVSDVELREMLPSVQQDQFESINVRPDDLRDEIRLRTLASLIVEDRLELAHQIYPELYDVFMYIEDHMNPDQGDDAYSITEYYMDRETREEELIFSMLYRQTPEIYDLFDLKLDEETIYRLLNGTIYWRNKELAAHIYHLYYSDSDEFKWVDLLNIADKILVETLLFRDVLPANMSINNILARVSQDIVCEIVEDNKMANHIYNI